MSTHQYKLQITWTGNRGEGTSQYDAYDRDHILEVDGKPDLQLSSDPEFLGNPEKLNPEELLVASLAGCHMLWYLHLCAENEITVISYMDHAEGTMTAKNGGLQFSEVNLNPIVDISNSDSPSDAERVHELAHERCFIARSVNFPVKISPSINGQ